MGKAGARRARSVTTAVLAGLLILCGCQSGRGVGVAPLGLERAGQRIPLNLPESTLQAAASEAYQAQLERVRAGGSLETDVVLVARAREVFGRLVIATANWQTDAPSWPWEVQILRNESIDAWCLPGGKLFVHSGALKAGLLSDAELAALLSHEMAHVLRGHPRERIAQQFALQASASRGTTPAGLAKSGGQGVQPDLRPEAYLPTANDPYSRAHEAEADRIGVELAARAGYDPAGALSMWDKLAGLPDARSARWPAGHALAAGRSASLQAYAQRVMPLYEQAVRP